MRNNPLGNYNSKKNNNVLNMTSKEYKSYLKEKRSEHEEQVDVVNYLNKNKILFTSMPNENKFSGVVRSLLIATLGKIRGVKVANRIISSLEVSMRKEGKKKGYPDLIIDEPNKYYKGLRIELKRRAKTLKTKMSTAHTKVSHEQEKWLRELNDRGYYAVVCYGADEAKDVIDEYMDNVL